MVKGGIQISTYRKQSLCIAAILLFILVSFPYIKMHCGKQLSFSKEPGYYDSAFYLTIRGGGKNTIHYTLDGSEPTINDPVFDRKTPLYIEDATNHPNVYSTRTDTSTGFLSSLIRKYSFPDYGYTMPRYSVDKCTIIRVSLFNDAGDCLDSIVGTYFVGFQGRSAYQDIYTASLVTAPENLFDDNSGIYVTGNTFRQFSRELPDESSEISPWWLWPSNYSNKGMDWERASYITLFDSHQNIVLSQKCGIRIKGGGSRATLPKSLSCYAREIYDGSNRFDANIFQTDIFPHKIVLFAGGDDNRFKLKDYLVNTMAQDLSFATMDFIPCAVFLDGEYWGMYYITEDYNAAYIHDHYQVDSDNIIMVKATGLLQTDLTEGSEEDYQKYEEMLNFIDEHDMSDSTNYDHACDLIDMESYIDYYATEIYIARYGDWPGGNFSLWRTRENDGSRYGDTKWRYMLFDVNSYGIGKNSLPNDTLSYVLTEDSTFSALYQNEDFRRQFASRLLYIGREVFAPEKCSQFLDQYARTLKDPIAASNMRFYMDGKEDEFDQNVTNIGDFFENRYDVVWNFLVENMGEEWLAQNGIQK